MWKAIPDMNAAELSEAHADVTAQIARGIGGHHRAERARARLCAIDAETQRRIYLHAATERGKEAAETAATWASSGNHDRAERTRVLAMLRAGDPQAYDYLPAKPDLSGEFADDLTPLRLFEFVVGRSVSEEGLDFESGDGALLDAIADAWEDAVSEAFGPACEAELIELVGEQAAGVDDADGLGADPTAVEQKTTYVLTLCQEPGADVPGHAELFGLLGLDNLGEEVDGLLSASIEQGTTLRP